MFQYDGDDVPAFINKYNAKIYRNDDDCIKLTLSELKELSVVKKFGCLQCMYLTHSKNRCFKFSYSLKAINDGVPFYSRNCNFLGDTSYLESCPGFKPKKGGLL